MKRWAVIIVTFLSLTFVVVPMTQAADEVAGRVVYHAQKVENMEAGDVPGHIVGVAQQSGLTFFTKGPASGQIATRMMNTSYDVVKWKGSYTTYRESALARQKPVAIRTPTSPAPNGSRCNPAAKV